MLVSRDPRPELAWFDQARFGMFIHFGLYALLGRGEWVMYRGPIPREQYVKLARRFNPDKFNPDEWIDLAEQAGMRYLTVTTKHHDGFCLFDSDLTDFKITNTPFGRDLIGELIAACQRRGMRICLYYSQPDWHHPNYVHRPGAFKDLTEPRESDDPNWRKYVAYYHGQVEELCTRYGKIDGLWFDGVHKSTEEWQGKRLYRMIKSHQPEAVVNERAGQGDIFTPERSLAAAPAVAGYRVESCQAIGADAWGWRRDGLLHNSPFLIRSLLAMAASNGNYLLNVGPLPDGTLPEDQVARLRDIGAWLERHGEAIFGTRGTPGLETGEARYTQRDNVAYALLPNWPERDLLELPKLRAKPTSAVLLGDGRELRLDRVDGVTRVRDLPSLPPDPSANVIKLTFETDRIFPKPPKPAPTPVQTVEARRTTRLMVPQAALRGFGSKGHLPGTRRKAGLTLAALTSPEHQVVWRLELAAAGTYRIELTLACNAFFAGSTLQVKAAGQTLTGTVPDTRELPASLAWGELRLPAGTTALTVQPKRLNYNYRCGDLAEVALTPVEPA